jgi:antitoxin YefM
MNTKTTIPISEARKRIFEIAEEVQKPDNYYTFTENGRPKAVLMSAEDFESWQETMEVMRDFPDLKKDIGRVERDFKSGAYKNYATLEEVMAEYNYVVADKEKTKYAVGAKVRKTSQKGSKKNS